MLIIRETDKGEPTHKKKIKIEGDRLINTILGERARQFHVNKSLTLRIRLNFVTH